MPRKKFIEDLRLVRADHPPRISNVENYEGDGLSFNYSIVQNGAQMELELKVIPTNIDDYPLEHEYIIFTLDSCTSLTLLAAIEQLSIKTARMNIRTALQTISDTLDQVFQTCSRDSQTNIRGSSLVTCATEGIPKDIEAEEAEDEEDHTGCSDEFGDFEGDSDDGFGFDDSFQPRLNVSFRGPRDVESTTVRKIKSDLRAVRHSGFRVGVYGNLTTSGIICLSIRVTKLGISEEAMKAWSLSRKHYLVLLIRFVRGYRTFSHMLSDLFSPQSLEMRTALCTSYKPSAEDAHNAFSVIETESQIPMSQLGTQALTGKLEPLFIGKPLNELLRDRFVPIAKFRSTLGLNWSAAEQLYHDNLGALTMSDGTIEKSQLITDGDDLKGRTLPLVSSADALAGQPSAENVSLPLVAMQFLLRHFVRCTEFCLVCHCKLENTFEALKPYVCSKPLCLYQFLAYGFGPPAEYDIISQPYVVDLLISLCLAQAAANTLKELPLGIGLKVPNIMSYRNPSNRGTSLSSPQELPKPTFRAKLDKHRATLEIGDSAVREATNFRGGEWIVVNLGAGYHQHYRVRNVIDQTLYLSDLIDPKRHGDPADDLGPEVDCFLYDQSFDELSQDCRSWTIEAMLQCIPSVTSMKKNLLKIQATHGQPDLRQLKSIPPAVQDLLRWIIASNRSCIMQVDQISPTTEPVTLKAFEPRITGMDSYIQFRFAQGAPDKEQRFVECVKKHTQNPKHPTIFAWHGSPLQNWHSIIRQGLNFDVVSHGRACGHGVYMSSQLSTSLGYAHGPSSFWCNSELKITQAVSLQEVVNAPSSFVSTSPHFVVAQKEWIQTRYLFVRSSTNHSIDKSNTAIYVQDPSYTAKGATGEYIEIPITALPKARRSSIDTSGPSAGKKQKTDLGAHLVIEDPVDDCISVATLEEDLRWVDLDADTDVEMYDDHDDDTLLVPAAYQVKDSVVTTPSSGQSRKHALDDGEGSGDNNDDAKYILDRGKTDFIPGSLDVSGIKFLPPPSDASSVATTALMKAFQATVKVQKTTPLHELGFYIDPDRIENVYQWIVELHSFDRSLPLAMDMQKAGISSVILEMRFTNQFPFAPPFVRVVKPRFLPFLQGGGGHVTEGGAICMELLTSSGWSVVSSIESVLLQIRLAMSDSERPARLQIRPGVGSNSTKDDYRTDCYDFGGAVVAFKRACAKHGWAEPNGIDSLTLQG